MILKVIFDDEENFNLPLFLPQQKLDTECRSDTAGTSSSLVECENIEEVQNNKERTAKESDVNNDNIYLQIEDVPTKLRGKNWFKWSSKPGKKLFRTTSRKIVSPSPAACSAPSPMPSPTPSIRRPSSALLHPDHARLFRLYQPSSPEQTSVEDVSEIHNGHASPSSSTTSSLTSIAAAVAISGSRSSDPCDSRRRSSTMTARYSLFDALDLEYAILRAAARGSVGPYSLSESLHKLTFTQSLAFPALARGLANKRRRSQQNSSSRPLDPSESGLNAFAKVVTALVLVLVSVLVFAVVYKFVRT
ncbi:hypothetical protein MML48_3g00004767 [Holotrichia oblita]|uniref:Uncharacterized protein n=1 Tax=Holotrichia oblita TaxID=644536 RepID=A0ACB9TGR2_HOLOL|nr:hypothetical protein MML48_3g00004767 [Holotrichia oblita]